VKEQLRAVPHQGLGYGLLRYANLDATQWTDARPRISFTNRGSMDGLLPPALPIVLAPESVDLLSGGPRRAVHQLQLTSAAKQGRLELACAYDSSFYSRAAIDRLLGECAAALRALIEHCQSQDSPQWTPSDFPLANMDEQTLEEVSLLIEQSDAPGAE
jgi:non-ribosomal peptide synthase protein (TIGR01720 family)